PLALLVQRSPESMGLLPDGAIPAHSSLNPSATHEPHVGNAKPREADFTLSQAMRTWAFWMIILATTTRVAVYNSITVHFVPIMVWKGVSEQRAATMLAIMSLMSLPSHLLVGWIADYVSKPRLMGACMVIGTASLFFSPSGRAKGHFGWLPSSLRSWRRFFRWAGQPWATSSAENHLPQSGAP